MAVDVLLMVTQLLGSRGADSLSAHRRSAERLHLLKRKGGSLMLEFCLDS